MEIVDGLLMFIYSEIIFVFVVLDYFLLDSDVLRIYLAFLLRHVTGIICFRRLARHMLDLANVLIYLLLVITGIMGVEILKHMHKCHLFSSAVALFVSLSPRVHAFSHGFFCVFCSEMSGL